MSVGSQQYGGGGLQRLQIRSDEAGARLDRILCDRLTLSRSQAKRLFEGGSVRRNGRRADKGELVVEGDTIEFQEEESSSEAWPDPEVEFRIRYEDTHLVVVEKPAGVPSHPLMPGEMGCLANGLLAQYPEMAHIGYDSRQPGLVNRLDNDTSGLMLAARTQPAFAALRAMLETGRIDKTYLALTLRPVKAQLIELPLAPSPRHRSRVEVSSLGRVAVTEVIGSRASGHYYLVEARAEKAYRHQVRVHLSAVGAPIVGDSLYGGEPGERHYLHAARMHFTHPMRGTPMDIEAPLPLDWPR
jgi:23S rRNA pseudouridine1911/1915/1917 synthase